MIEDTKLKIVAYTIGIFEYSILSLFILFKIKNRKTLCIEPSPVIRLFWAFIIILCILRIIACFLILFDQFYAYEIFERLGYSTTFQIYSLICYSWQHIFRLSSYFLNSYHYLDSYKLKLIHRVKWAIITFNMLGILILVILIILYYKYNSKDSISNEKAEHSLGFRLYYGIYVGIGYFILMTVGCLLVKQINKYYTERPLVLIISLYIILIDLSFAVVCMLMFEAIPGIINDAVR